MHYFTLFLKICWIPRAGKLLFFIVFFFFFPLLHLTCKKLRLRKVTCFVQGHMTWTTMLASISKSEYPFAIILPRGHFLKRELHTVSNLYCLDGLQDSWPFSRAPKWFWMAQCPSSLAAFDVLTRTSPHKNSLVSFHLVFDLSCTHMVFPGSVSCLYLDSLSLSSILEFHISFEYLTVLNLFLLSILLFYCFYEDAGLQMIKQVLSQFYVCPSSMLSVSDFQLPVREDESLRGIGTKLTAPREQGQGESLLHSSAEPK